MSVFSKDSIMGRAGNDLLDCITTVQIEHELTPAQMDYVLATIMKWSMEKELPAEDQL